MQRQPFLFGVQGHTLTDGEVSFFKATQPAGFVLSDYNIQSPQQVSELIKSLKMVVQTEQVFIILRTHYIEPRRYFPSFPAVNTLFLKIAQNDENFRHINNLKNTLRALIDPWKMIGFNLLLYPYVNGLADLKKKMRIQYSYSIAQAVRDTLLKSGFLPCLRNIAHDQTQDGEHKENETLLLTALNDTTCAEIAPRLLKSSNRYALANALQINVRKNIGFNGILFSPDISALPQPEIIARNLLISECDLIMYVPHGTQDHALQKMEKLVEDVNFPLSSISFERIQGAFYNFPHLEKFQPHSHKEDYKKIFKKLHYEIDILQRKQEESEKKDHKNSTL